MRVIGTAGHVDHGKSTLIRALTGIDPDRLAEEKEREMTIDLGFAWLELPSGQSVSVVDVPGHEDFIKNMLAGVGGIDVALFVVAADEGVMPQTREHLAILDLLDVQDAVIALTKQDIVEDPEWLMLVEEDIRDEFAGTVLEHAPMIPVSARTGYGLEALLAELDRVIDKSKPKRDIGKPRLPIDRAFSLTGFGTVVTGTLVDGQLTVGQEVEILPQGLKSRIRGLQTHKQKLDVAVPGSRVAVNIVGVSTDELERGQVIAQVGTLEATEFVDVHLELLSNAPKPLEHNTTIDFYIGASVTPARVRLLGIEMLEPGQEGWAQLVPASPIVAVKGEKFIIRQPSPSLTIGGGYIVDPHPQRRHRRFRAETIQRLETLAKGTPEEIIVQTLERDQPAQAKDLLQASHLDLDVAHTALMALLARGQITALGAQDAEPEQIIASNRFLFTESGWRDLRERIETMLGAFHRQNPLRVGMPRTELASRLHLATNLFNACIARAQTEGWIEDTAIGSLRLPDFRIIFTSAQQARIDQVLEAFRAEPFTPPSRGQVDDMLNPDLLGALLELRVLISVSDEILFAADTYDHMIDELIRYLKAHGTVTLAQARDLFGTSRRYATALLEHLDEERVTRRVGDERVLRTT